MTVTDTTLRSQTESLSFEVELAHAPAKVWRALTDPALVAEWLLPPVDLEIEPGRAFRFQTNPQPGWDGVVHCRVLEADRPRMLRYTWAVGDMELDTIVTFTLTPTDSGTHLSIVQSGFKPVQKQAFGGARYGWRMMSGKLVDLLARIS